MKVTEHLKKAKGTLFSIEILPPLKGKSIQSIYSAIDPLLEFKPAFIDVTYHREEYVYKKKPNGLLEKKSVKKRPGTVGVSRFTQIDVCESFDTKQVWLFIVSERFGFRQNFDYLFNIFHLQQFGLEQYWS